jgi:hypothetical protein
MKYDIEGVGVRVRKLEGEKMRGREYGEVLINIRKLMRLTLAASSQLLFLSKR